MWSGLLPDELASAAVSARRMSPAEHAVVDDLGWTGLPIAPADLVGLDDAVLATIQELQALAAITAQERADTYLALHHALLPWLRRGDAGLLPALRRAGTAIASSGYYGAKARHAFALANRFPDLVLESP